MQHRLSRSLLHDIDIEKLQICFSAIEALMGFRSSISTSVPTDSPPAESTSSKVPDVDPSRSPIPLSSSQEAQVYVDTPYSDLERY